MANSGAIRKFVAEFPSMNKYIWLQICWLLMVLYSCHSSNHDVTLQTEADSVFILESLLPASDSSAPQMYISAERDQIRNALQTPIPVIRCRDSLSTLQNKAQQLLFADSILLQTSREQGTNRPQRTEIFGIYPVRESDLTERAAALEDCFRIEWYNYARNTAYSVIADIRNQRLFGFGELMQAQPDIPEYLKKLAIRIAIESPEVQRAYGIAPTEKEALMASTKTALNRSRCERSRHLCVAPTFIKGDKALWTIVDLTELRVAGIRWTTVGKTGPPATLTERKLQDDKITACFCDRLTHLQKGPWSMDYQITSSDGLRISDVSYRGKPILKSAKLVDWHVSYSGTDGFGYSDAVGCPYFSQAAVVAVEVPQVAELRNEHGETIGFTLDQTFRSEGWPTPCNYNYHQRFEFYLDGRFRVAAASFGRGCGNDGTYRPVFRIAFAGKSVRIHEWERKQWNQWTQERWTLQGPATSYTDEGYQFRIDDPVLGTYFLEPSRGQFSDGGKGDHAFVYACRSSSQRDEGETDLVTIGPCCNTDYHQGPDKFIDPNPEPLGDSPLVLWYVPQLRNNNTPGAEYCWAESVLENGVYVTKVYPCFCGPMFVPQNKQP